MSSIPRVENDIAKAREDVHADFEALGREIGRDEREIGQMLRQWAPMLAGAVGAMGILIGLGGWKVIRAFLIAGAAGGITYALLRNRT